MKKIIKAFIAILQEIKGLWLYICDIVYYKVLFLILDPTPMRRFPLKNQVDASKTICVLANGPSLKEVLPKIEHDQEFANADFSVMNFFANDPLYTIIQPKIYCLWDSMFDTRDERYDKVIAMFKNMNELTTWPMTLYVKKTKKQFLEFSKLTNPNIKIVTLSSVSIHCKDSVRYFFYKHGLAMPPAATVANINVWTALQIGYKNIRLYGVDMTFFEGLCVNEKNEVCATMRHFYDKNVEIVPIYNYFAKRVFRLAEFIDMVNAMVKAHDDLAKYAKYLDVSIINCCPVSMLDCYPRN